MEVPKKILVDYDRKSPQPTQNGVYRHQPAGYSSDSDDDDFLDDDDYSPTHYKINHNRVEPAARLMSPPEKLTLPEITDEERRRYLRENSMSETGTNAQGANAYLNGADESLYRTPNNDTVFKNMNSFQSGDPVSLARQVRHLHNRVKLLEEELQTQSNRQIFIFGILSVYFLSKGVRMMFH